MQGTVTCVCINNHHAVYSRRINGLETEVRGLKTTIGQLQSAKDGLTDEVATLKVRVPLQHHSNFSLTMPVLSPDEAGSPWKAEV